MTPPNANTNANTEHHADAHLDAGAVRKVAALALLDVPDEQCAELGRQLNAVIDHVERLRALDLSDVEPMAHACDLDAPLDDDDPGPTYNPEVLAMLANDDETRLHREPATPGSPATASRDDHDNLAPPGPDQVFLRVPRVLGDPGGGA